METYTYAITTSNGAFVKIGKTANIRARMQALATCMPYTLRCAGYFVGDIEKDLHLKLTPYHVRGEWFEPEVLEILTTMEGFREYDNVIELKIKDPVVFLTTDFDSKWELYKLSTTAQALILYILLNMDCRKLDIVLNREHVLSDLKNFTPEQYDSALKELIDHMVIGTPKKDRHIIYYRLFSRGKYTFDYHIDT